MASEHKKSLIVEQVLLQYTESFALQTYCKCSELKTWACNLSKIRYHTVLSE